MMQRAGLTLIELLISITLGMILLAMGSSALLQVSQIAKRDTAQRKAHGQVGLISGVLADRLGAIHHGSQMRVEADVAAGSVTLIWMSSLSALDERDSNISGSYGRSLVWNMLQWKRDPDHQDEEGTISYAMSSRGRSQSFSYTDSMGAARSQSVKTTVQWRRDRRRDMNDNDGRWIPGMRKDIWEDMELSGDLDDLYAQLLPFHPSTTKTKDFVIEWVDAGGVVVRCDAKTGVTINGASVLAQTWSNGAVHVVDGVFQDGREHVSAGSSRLAMAERPCVVRIGCTLIPLTNSGLDLGDEPHLPFKLAFATTPHLPYLR